MNLDNFLLLRTIFELRFERQFAIWDRAGAFATGLAEVLPRIELVSSAPNKQQFVLLSPDKKTRTFTAEIELTRLAIVFHKPQRSLAEAAEMATVVVRTFHEHL